MLQNSTRFGLVPKVRPKTMFPTQGRSQSFPLPHGPFLAPQGFLSDVCSATCSDPTYALRRDRFHSFKHVYFSSGRDLATAFIVVDGNIRTHTFSVKLYSKKRQRRKTCCIYIYIYPADPLPKRPTPYTHTDTQKENANRKTRPS